MPPEALRVSPNQPSAFLVRSADSEGRFLQASRSPEMASGQIAWPLQDQAADFSSISKHEPPPAPRENASPLTPFRCRSVQRSLAPLEWRRVERARDSLAKADRKRKLGRRANPAGFARRCRCGWADSQADTCDNADIETKTSVC